MNIKTFILVFVALACKTLTFAQPETDIVKEFGSNISKWCQSKNAQFRQDAQSATGENCRIMDAIMRIFEEQEPEKDASYLIESYFNGFQRTLMKGEVQYSMNNIRLVPEEKRTINDSTTTYGRNKAITSLAEKCTYVICEVRTTGVINVSEKLTFYVYKDNKKIIKIEPTKEIIDQQTGEKKIELFSYGTDWEDIIGVPEKDVKTMNISYNYSKDFPIGFSVDYSWSWFMLGLSGGFKTDKKNQLITDKVNFKDIMNFDREHGVYDPKGYALITPAVYLKHFSIGCGFGILDLEGEFEQAKASTDTFTGTDGTIVSYPFSSTTSTESKILFMIQPKVSYYLSFDGDYDEGIGLNISLGYNHIPQYTRMNGFSIGVGFVIFGF